MGRLGLFVSLANIPSLVIMRFTSPQYERGMGSSLSIPASPLVNTSVAFAPLLQGERGMGQEAHFVSLLALRVTAGGRNP